MVPEPAEGPSQLDEGGVSLAVVPSGPGKGPGSRARVFYNPSMSQNRDLSVLFMSALLDSGSLPGPKGIKVLDGHCGSGVRVIRMAKELGKTHPEVKFMGTDISREAIAAAEANAASNDVDVTFIRQELISHLSAARYSYIDVDPYGTPIHFLFPAIRSVLPGGVIGVTATDTPALTGSLPKVARRRYGVEMRRTPYMHELSCRVMMGCISRISSSIGRGAFPLMWYSSDHFIRGYVRIMKGSAKADASIQNIGWLDEDPPKAPVVLRSPSGRKEGSAGSKVLGPLWIGYLEDPDLLVPTLDRMEGEGSYGLSDLSRRSLSRLLARALKEHGLPIGGYDMNEVAKETGTSPLPLDEAVRALGEKGFKTARSRFSPTLLKTDAPWEEVKAMFERKGGK